MKVTNHHTGILIVAGVEVRPGATVAVDEQKFQRWTNGHAAKLWLKQGIITTGEPPKKEPEPKEPEPKGDERQELLEKARELGLNPNANTGIEKLQKMIAEKQGE